MHVFYTGRVPYLGTTAQGTKVRRHHPTMLRPGTQPALVPIDVFEHCQEIRRQLARPTQQVLHTQRADFPLAGILFCSECGGHMIGSRCRGERRYYCNARIQHRVNCSQPSVPAELIESTILRLLSNFIWPEDWREQWKQVLESAWDTSPLLSDEMEKEKIREERLRR